MNLRKLIQLRDAGLKANIGLLIAQGLLNKEHATNLITQVHSVFNDADNDLRGQLETILGGVEADRIMSTLDTTEL